MRLTARRRYLVDPKVQRALLLKAFGYWCGCVLAVGLLLMVWDAMAGPPRPFLDFFSYEWLWDQHAIMIVGAVAVLPLLLIDVLVTSNRFAGPIYRMRRSMRALAAGEFVQPIEFRETDFLHDVAEEFNAVVAYVEHLKKNAEVATQLQQASTVEMPALVSK